MRESKYRGLNKDSGEFVYGYYTKLVEGIRRFDAIISDIDGELTRFYIHDSKTIGQYTGLKDKNGKEIYEGDILHDGKGKDMTVKYHQSTAMFMCFVGNESWYLNEGDPNRPCQLQYTEIIGNIHEEKDNE